MKVVMKTAAIPSSLRRMNRRLILRHMVQVPQAARLELAKVAGTSCVTAGKIVDELLDAYESSRRADDGKAWTELQTGLRESFNLQLPSPPPSREPERLQELILEALRADFEVKRAYAGDANLNNFIRFQYLQAIDQKWLDHLENMEALREAVYLRHYAQKNPLLEYKLEGFDIFDRMIDEIRRSVASTLFLVRIQRQEPMLLRFVDALAGFGLSPQQRGQPLGLAIGTIKRVLISELAAVGDPGPRARVAGKNAGPALDLDQEQASWCED